MRATFIAFTFVLIAACSQVHPFSDEERADIDCLAAITVVEITDAARASAERGMDSAEMAEIRRQKIADATQVLHAAYVGRMDEAYLEFDINNRLAKIEAAIESGDPLSEEGQVMTETLELGRTCTFGGE